MSAVKRFRLNSPSVAAQIIDGEAIVIHFETGCYYSTEKIGAEIVGYLEKSASFDTIVDKLSERCAVPAESVRGILETFLRQLEDEQLIVPATSPEGGSTDQAAPSSNGSDCRLSLEAPVLERFTDLEDLLLLDPIHDTDESGWPAVKPADEDATS